ncbi:Ig-like domain-containing protein [Halorhodospira halophila]|uniref:Ig-like domain-containing protein n=1 Tax=Halorhodospira halophila TaxID=1053 RepID=UPI00119828A0|nr:Ig-like domain-containing protein [Halorhodospira halophila]
MSSPIPRVCWLALILAAFLTAGCISDSDDDDDASSETQEESGENGDEDDGDDDPLPPSEPSDKALQIGAWGDGGEFESGSLTFGLDGIGPSGTTSVEAVVVDEDVDPVGEDDNVQVRFTSDCVEAEEAAFSQSRVEVIDGVAQTDYTAQGCAESDTIRAEVELTDETIQASADLRILNIGSLVFEEADPEHIGLEGMAGVRETTSNVRFQLLDVYGDPIEGERIEFEVTPKTGGLELDRTSARTDEEGRVSAQVLAGTVATPVRVTGRVQGNPNIAGQSERLWVSTGIPTEEGLSLSAERLNADAWSCDGEVVEITVRARDRFSNPVIDGTTINFSTQGGAIEPSCQTEDGVCTVEWRSQNPRPETGRTTILAYAIGEESFLDHTGDGRFGRAEAEAWVDARDDDDKDKNQIWADTGEPFRDDHEQWFDEPMDYASEEFTPGVDGIFFDFDGSSLASEGYDFEESNSGTWTGPNQKFDGLLCKEDELESVPEVGCGEDFAGIGAQTVLVMSGRLPFRIEPESDEDVVLEDGANDVTFVVRDGNDQPLPAGTEVRIDATVYQSRIDEDFDVDLVLGPRSLTVGSTNQDSSADDWSGEEGVDEFTFTLRPLPDGLEDGWPVVIEVETPGEACWPVQRSRSISVKSPDP